jgi:hypothetical protein
VKSWEVIADNLSKAGWSWGCVSAVVRADEKLTAFLELERVMRESLRFLNAGSTSQT